MYEFTKLIFTDLRVKNIRNDREEKKSPPHYCNHTLPAVFVSVTRTLHGLLGGAQMWSTRLQDGSASTSKHLREIKTVTPAGIREQQSVR